MNVWDCGLWWGTPRLAFARLAMTVGFRQPEYIFLSVVFYKYLILKGM